MSHRRADTLAIIGSAGVPQRYGGFEAFVEHCGPSLLQHFSSVIVSCDRALYQDRSTTYRGMRRVFPPFRANGPQSILHDFLSFCLVLPRARTILVLGVSAGPWFVIMRMLASMTGASLAVNVDGVEWQRPKHSAFRRSVLKAFDRIAQLCAHTVVYDNPALLPYVSRAARKKSAMIAYSGDHAAPDSAVCKREGVHALTVCRIEPENSIEMLISGFLMSNSDSYTIIGNWQASDYGRALWDRYGSQPRLSLRNPIYDPAELRRIRNDATVYIHGHTVGGTNPSLVEMVFFECRLLCIDVPYHRATVGNSAEFFRDADSLATLLSSPAAATESREHLRLRYTADAIASQYAHALRRRAHFQPPMPSDS